MGGEGMAFGDEQGQGMDGYGQSPARAYAYNGDGRGRLLWVF